MNSADIISLNEDQREAVQYNTGPLLIIAGAGTGKTTIIVEKIKFLIGNKIAEPDKILALTFTEKAATEMETRVDQAMPYGYFQMSISTFHAFADRILKQEAHEIGLPANYKIMTEAETIIFLRKNLFKFKLKYYRPLGNPHKFLENLLNHFSRLKDEDISPEEYRRFVAKKKDDRERLNELAEAYTLYESLKIKEGLFDYSDLVASVLKIFRKRKSVLRKYQKQFTTILVDEFQDTNISQYALIKLLSPPKNKARLTVVGDDSQAIYKFRGASVSNIMSFMNDYKKAKQITVRSNYRSNQTILNAAYQLIKFNDPDTLEAKLGISKELIGRSRGKPDSVELSIQESAEAEAEAIVSNINKYKNDFEYRDMAILVRANSHANPLFQALSRAGIPYQFLGPSSLYKQSEIKDLIAYLKLLDNLEDTVAFYRVLTMKAIDIDARDIAFLLSTSKKTNLPLFQTIEMYLSFFYPSLSRAEFEIYKKYLPLLREETRKKLYSLFLLISRHLSRLKNDTAGQILFDFLEKTGILKKMTAYATEHEERHAINISQFFNRLRAYEIEHEDASVGAFVDYIDMSLELGDSPLIGKEDIANVNAVNILTVHGSKGLEFPIVFMPSLVQGRFPTYEKREVIPIPDELIKEILPIGDYHLEEERRLFYVAMTRARDKLFLSCSRFYGEGKRERKVSQFVSEALGEKQIETYLLTKKEEKHQLTIFDFKKPEPVLLKPKLDLTTFSFSQITTYETCPLQYKYQYILKIPTTQSSAASYGDTIHQTLEEFYREFKINQKIAKDKLLSIFESKWIPIGYNSALHEKRMKEEGKKMLVDYFNKLHDKKASVGSLEQFFKIKIAEDIAIVGKIDRVDYKKNGVIEIIDYKTGKKPEEKKLKNSLQLSIYALAATDKGLYAKELSKVILTFYYFQNMEKISMTRMPEDMYKMKEQIKSTVNAIRNSDFTPKVGPWCDFCPFRLICEAWQ